MFLGHESKAFVSLHNAKSVAAPIPVSPSFVQPCNAFCPKLSIKGFIMKRCLAVLLAALTAITLGTPQSSKAAAVSFGVGMHINSVADFNAPLRPFGTWTAVGRFGRVWRPARVAVDWRPYSVGSWVWTSAGWFWRGDEPWAWATYHAWRTGLTRNGKYFI
jgi:hypothetical protein